MDEWTEQTIRLNRCPRCRYDLSALPRRHRCPECGFVYDESMFLVEGWRLPDLRGWVRSSLVYAPLTVVVTGFLRFELSWSWSAILAILMGVLMLVAVLYLVVWLRDRGGRRVLARYLITEDGVARPGKHTYLWRNYTHIMLLRDGNRAWRIHIYPSWWRLFGPPIVNARLECSDAEAEAVRSEIQRRISAARRGESEGPVKTLPRRWWGG